MAISTRLGRCYRRSCRCSAPCIREQGAQGRQRGQGRNRLRRRARGAACTGIEHPGLGISSRARDGRVHETAAGRGARRSLDHLVKANWAPSPGMPGVDNRDLVASCRTMGLVVRSCIIGSACPRPEATAPRLRRGPAWRRSPRALRREIPRHPLHTKGEAQRSMRLISACVVLALDFQPRPGCGLNGRAHRFETIPSSR